MLHILALSYSITRYFYSQVQGSTLYYVWDFIRVTDVSRLYLVHISGLWDSPLLLYNHCTSLFTAARHCRRHLHKAATVKFSYSHSQDKIRTDSDKHIHKKKEKEHAFILCRCHFNQCRCHFNQRTVLPTRKWQLEESQQKLNVFWNSTQLSYT